MHALAHKKCTYVHLYVHTHSTNICSYTQKHMKIGAHAHIHAYLHVHSHAQGGIFICVSPHIGPETAKRPT